MQTENYAYLNTLQSIYSQLGIKLALGVTLWDNFQMIISDKRGTPCALIEMGPVLIKGNLIMTWKKKFPYGPLFNY